MPARSSIRRALLLADEPTSDLDEDTETDIIDLLEQLQRTESFGFVLVTHNLELAKRAQRTYEMRQGVLAATDLPRIRGRAGTPTAASDPAKVARRRTSRCPRPRWRRPSAWAPACGAASQIFLLAAAVIFAGILLADFGDREISKDAGSRSATRGSRPCSTWRSTACAATSSRSPISATAATN